MSAGFGFLRHLIVRERSLLRLGELGIIPGYFLAGERTVYEYVRHHVTTYGIFPDLETVKKETEVSFPPGLPDETLEFWADRVKDRNETRIILEVTEDLRKACAEGLLPVAREKARDLYQRLQPSLVQESLHRFDQLIEEIVEDHDKRQRATIRSGVPFGLPFLDVITDGAQPADTVALVGRPSVGKSYLLLHMALKAWEHGFTPLFMTMEMSAKQCARRLVALHSQVSATDIRLGRLSYYGRDKLTTDVKALLGKEGPPFYFLQGTMTSTVEDLSLHIRELHPSVIYVDGAYLLRTRNRSLARWERVSETAEFLKMVAISFDLPIISTYQFNRRGPGSLSNIAFSDVVGQLASIAISIDDDAPENSGTYEARQYKLLELMKGREGERGQFRVLYDIQRMIIKQESMPVYQEVQD